MDENAKKNELSQNFHGINFWENLVNLPIKTACNGVLAGLFAAGFTLLIDGGWEPAIRKYVAFFGFVIFGLGYGIFCGLQNYSSLKKIYQEENKQD